MKMHNLIQLIDLNNIDPKYLKPLTDAEFEEMIKENDDCIDIDEVKFSSSLAKYSSELISSRLPAQKSFNIS